jgi:cis-L-3-hydroxyproline dehydratase
MQISRIDVYGFPYSIVGGSFGLSGGRVMRSMDSTIVKLSTDDGPAGWGEHCPIPSYMIAHPEGARAAIRELGPYLLGMDPRQIEVVYARMDQILQGHNYAKSALDMACWDLLGQAAGLPISDLLGGTYQTEFRLLTAIGMAEPERMRERGAQLREEGYQRLQIKVGGDWREDLRRIHACMEVIGDIEVVIVDANAYWPRHAAAQVVAAIEDLPLYVEQPCRTLDANLAIRRRTARPFILDETLTDLDAVMEAQRLDALDCAMLKLSRFGGISRLKQARDLLQRWGISMTIEDGGGGDIVAAASAHLAASTRPVALLNGSLINGLINEHIAGGPRAEQGLGRVPRGPGLGIEVDERALGAPLFSITA